jgi:hypothetical protein
MKTLRPSKQYGVNGQKRWSPQSNLSKIRAKFVARIRNCRETHDAAIVMPPHVLNIMEKIKALIYLNLNHTYQIIL